MILRLENGLGWKAPTAANKLNTYIKFPLAQSKLIRMEDLNFPESAPIRLLLIVLPSQFSGWSSQKRKVL